jgi:glycosyltransferase involved in cell wall biosynthesis
MSSTKLKIIHIMNHLPAYEEYPDKPRPAINWDTSNDSWVGIWGYDWSDQIANEVLKLTDEFEHEVWQPDVRADKIYSHTFENRLIHRSFPASITSHEEIYSPQMLDFIPISEHNDRYIFHLGYPHFLGINKSLLDTYKNYRYILTFHGEINLPYNALFSIQKNPLKKIFYLKQHFTAKSYFKSINHITYQSDKNLKTLKKYYNGQLTKLTMGLDTTKYKKIEPNEYKKKLLIPYGKKVLLTVSRLYNLKQVDKFIDVLNGISEDFIFLVIGHGRKEYENYLKEKAKGLMDINKIKFVGYKSGNELIEYYNAADLFIHVSKSEAGPVSVMEAMACGLPIFCTDTGNAAELLKANNAGMIVGISRYVEWREKLTYYLRGVPIKALDIGIVRSQYDWNHVAEIFLEIYKKISQRI